MSVLIEALAAVAPGVAFATSAFAQTNSVTSIRKENDSEHDR
jgi:hypothetical protein